MINKDKIVQLLAQPELGTRPIGIHEGSPFYGNCHGFSMYVFDLYSHERPLALHHKKLQLLLDDDVFVPTSQLENSLVVFSSLKSVIVHSAVGVNNYEVVHQINTKEKYEKKNMEQLFLELFPCDYKLYALHKQVSFPTRNNMIYTEDILKVLGK